MQIEVPEPSWVKVVVPVRRRPWYRASALGLNEGGAPPR